MHTIKLCKGAGNGIDTACLLTAVSIVEGQPENLDNPSCVCPVIRAFILVTNDMMPDSVREELYSPLVWELPGTKADISVMLERARIFAHGTQVFSRITNKTKAATAAAYATDATNAAATAYDAAAYATDAAYAAATAYAATAAAYDAAYAAYAATKTADDADDDAAEYTDAEYAADADDAADAAAYITKHITTYAAKAAEYAAYAAEHTANTTAIAEYAATHGAKAATYTAYAAEYAATYAAKALIYEYCVTLIKVAISVGDKRPIELVKTPSQLASMLN